MKNELAGYFGERSLDFRVAARRSEGPETVIGFSVAYEVGLERFPMLAPFFEGSGGSNGHAGSARFVYGDELGVDADWRRRGIGTALLAGRLNAYDLAFGADGGAPAAFMIGRTDLDSKTVPIYKRLGYIFTGIMDTQYPGRGYFFKQIR